MVKILEINGTIIIAILYVFYCEINAEVRNLEFWNPNPDDGARRAQTTEKKAVTVNKKNESVALRHSKGHETDIKFTKGFRAEIRYSSPKNHPKHGPPPIEPILRNHEDRNSDSDSSMDKNDYKDKKQNRDKNRNKDRDHKIDKNSNKNRNSNMNKKHDSGRNVNSNKKHNTDDSNENTMNRIQNKNQNKIQSKNQNKDKKKDKDRDHNKNKDKDHNMERDQSKDTHRDKDKNTNKDKNPNKDKNYKKDKNPYKDKSHHSNKEHDMVSDHHMNIYESDNPENDHHMKSDNKDRFKIKSRGKDAKIGGPIRIPKLQPESILGGVFETTSKWPSHHHRSKLRTHKTDEEIHFIQSTRMTPMYLMQKDEEGAKPAPPEGGGGGSSLPHYLSPYSLTSQMTRIMAEFPNVNSTIETIGRTVEYNDIIIVKITEKKNDLNRYFRAKESKYIDEVPEKKIILIVHGLSVMGMDKLGCLTSEHDLKILLSYYFAHLNKFDIFLIPMANPDGYSATHSMTQWNKNVSPQDACPGVALDRNFDVAWNSTRKISSCSQLYPGPAPFSEIEAKAVKDVFHYHGHKILAYIHVHAGTYSDKVFKGDAILYPRGYTETQSDDDKYIDLKGEIDEAMKNASFQVMSVSVDTLFNWYGKVSGSSVDYASSVYGIPYALEFVMQLYEGGGAEGHETNEYYALTEIWRRMIVTTFNNLWKSLHVNEVKRK